MRRPIPLSALLVAIALSCCNAAAFDLEGHRGARGLAPENTLPAFERALAIGVSTLELDIGVTADGVLVISHDPYLNPAIARDASGQWLATRGPLIKDLSYAQLQAYDVGRIDPASPYARTFSEQQPVDGTRIPTLVQLFERVRALGADHVRFNIETTLSPLQPQETVAMEAMTDALLRTIRDAGMTRRVSIQSFDWRSLQRVQQREPTIPTVYLTVQTGGSDNTRDGTWTAGLRLEQHGGSVPRMVKAAGGKVWSPNAGAVTQALVQEAQALGLAVVPWTINDPADMDRLVGWGVDGLITDHPDRLRAVLQKRGIALPPQVSRAKALP